MNGAATVPSWSAGATAASLVESLLFRSRLLTQHQIVEEARASSHEVLSRDTACAWARAASRAPRLIHRSRVAQPGHSPIRAPAHSPGGTVLSPAGGYAAAVGVAGNGIRAPWTIAMLIAVSTSGA
jgi:hypothetical protein